jgi:hypothetical protein
MYDLRNLTDAELMDLLSEQTAKLTNLFAKRLVTAEYERCKLFIKALTAEIQARKNFANDRAANTNDSFFTLK